MVNYANPHMNWGKSQGSAKGIATYNTPPRDIAFAPAREWLAYGTQVYARLVRKS